MVTAQVTIKEEDKISQAMEQYISDNREMDIVRAWRIQIITTDDRREMERARSDFRILYPGIKNSWEHTAPYYKVKVGAYENKEDLEAFLLKLKKDFPSAIPVRDDVKKEDLIEGNG